MLTSIIVVLLQCVCKISWAEFAPQKFVPLVSSKLALNSYSYLTPNIKQYVYVPDTNRFILYYSPINILHDKRRSSSNRPLQYKIMKPSHQLRKFAVPKQIHYPYLSVHLEPPSPHLESNFAKFHDLEDERTMNEDGSLEDSYEIPKNHRPIYTDTDSQSGSDHDNPNKYIRDHAPIDQNITNDQESDAKPNRKFRRKKKKLIESLELSNDGDRVEFHMQGHEGPSTYVFGFDTGDGKNRQFRLEEKQKDGTVKGHYGYYDARGKLRAVKYLARPDEGFLEQHHLSNDKSNESEE